MHLRRLSALLLCALLAGCGQLSAPEPVPSLPAVPTPTAVAEALPTAEALPAAAPAGPEDLSLYEGYTESPCWDALYSVAYYPVRVLRQTPDPADPWQGQDMTYGCGPKLAFQAADQSWCTGFDYYGGSGGTLPLISKYGIFALKGPDACVLLDFHGQEKFTYAVPSALQRCAALSISDGMLLTDREAGEPILFLNLENGTVLQPDGLESADTYQEGLSLAQESGSGIYGFLNKTGNWALPPQYVSASPFQGGQATVTNLDGTLAVIDTTGKSLLTLPKPKGGYGRGQATLSHYFADSVHCYEVQDWQDTLLRLDGAFQEQPLELGGHEISITAEGWCWYDDGTSLRLWRGEQRAILPTGYEVLQVVDQRVYVRAALTEGLGAPAVFTLTGVEVPVPAGTTELTPLTDGVSGKVYLLCLSPGYCTVLTRDGRVLSALPREEGDSAILPLRTARALRFSPDAQTGALLVGCSLGPYWPA